MSDTGAGTPLPGDVEALTEDIASMLHYRASLPKPDRHERTRGGQGPSTCFACSESARQAVEFVKVFALGGYPLDAARSRTATDSAGLREPCRYRTSYEAGCATHLLDGVMVGDLPYEGGRCSRWVALAEAALDAVRPANAVHEHKAEYPSRCEGCEHVAADLVSRAPEWMLASRPATDPAGLDARRLAEAWNTYERKVVELDIPAGVPSTHHVGCAHVGLLKEEYARLSVADGLGPETAWLIDPAGLPDHGFAADRPIGPRTMEGHALARNLRDRDAEVDWDAWVRSVEEAAVRLSVADGPGPEERPG